MLCRGDEDADVGHDWVLLWARGIGCGFMRCMWSSVSGLECVALASSGVAARLCSNRAVAVEVQQDTTPPARLCLCSFAFGPWLTRRPSALLACF